MNIEKMRTDFEAVAEQHFMLKERYLYWDEGEDEYEDPDVQLAYEFFLLSRESLVIDLPPEDTNIDYPGYISRNETIEAIHAVGVKTK